MMRACPLKPMKKKIILLGARGFIGSFLASTLQKTNNFELTAWGSRDCDLTDHSQVQKRLIPLLADSHVIMCSSILRLQGEPLEIYEKNVAMALNLIRASQESTPASFVFLSSTDVYGRPPCINPMREEAMTCPTGNYGLSKLASEYLLELNLKCPLAILRLPGIYGPGDKAQSIIGKFTQRIQKGETITLDGKGEALRDYFHVQNIADIVTELLHSPRSDTYNLATGKSISLLEIVQTIGEALKVKPEIRFNKDCAPQYDFVFDASKLKRDFKTIDWIDVKRGISLYIKAMA